MHTKALIVGALAASCSLVAAQDAAPLVGRDDPTHTKKHNRHEDPALQTVEPSKLSAYHSDMHSLRSKIKADPMYTSMKAVMKTAIPSSYKDAIRTNPQSVHSRYISTPPEWYQSLPTNVKSFMENNRKAAKSVYEKDIGPVPSGGKYPGAGYLAGSAIATAPGASSTGKQPNKGSGGSKSEGPGVSVYGAAVCALVGAFGVAALLL